MEPNISERVLPILPTKHSEKYVFELRNLNNSYMTECWLEVGDGLDNNTDYVYSEAVSVIGGLGALITGIGGSMLNLLVIIAFMKTPSLRKEYLTPFMVSLAMTDLIFSAIALPMLAIGYFARDWPFGMGLCKFFPLPYFGMIMCTWWNLVAIAAKHSKELRKSVAGTKFLSKKNLEKEKRFGKMMAILTILFILTYLPVAILSGVAGEKESSEFPALSVLLRKFSHLSVIIDPLVYIIYHKRYRQAIKNVAENIFKGKGTAPMDIPDGTGTTQPAGNQSQNVGNGLWKFLGNIYTQRTSLERANETTEFSDFGFFRASEV